MRTPIASSSRPRPASLIRVLGDRFTHYYVVAHHNTAYPHAHVIGYTSTKLSKTALNTMRAQVTTLEQAHAQERTQQADAYPKSSPLQRSATPAVSGSAGHDRDPLIHTGEVRGGEPARHRRRGQELE